MLDPERARVGERADAIRDGLVDAVHQLSRTQGPTFAALLARLAAGTPARRARPLTTSRVARPE
jgi:hypothetical protein